MNSSKSEAPIVEWQKSDDSVALVRFEQISINDDDDDDVKIDVETGSKPDVETGSGGKDHEWAIRVNRVNGGVWSADRRKFVALLTLTLILIGALAPMIFFFFTRVQPQGRFFLEIHIFEGPIKWL